MTELTPQAAALAKRHPRLYHMAERGSWPMIQRHGLRSTLALLDLFEADAATRETVGHRHRRGMVPLRHAALGEVVIRDQNPMPPLLLAKALIGSGLTPEEWYAFLNGFVFLWPTEKRLHGLLNSRAYRHKEHEVLTLNTAALLERHHENIWLSPLNSGSIYAKNPAPRSYATFVPLTDYPQLVVKRGASNAVAELVVKHAVPDVAEFVEKVEVWRGEECLGALTA